MRLTVKDLAATIVVAGAVTLYACFLVDANLPLVSGPRALAGAVFVLGIVGCALGGSSGTTLDRTRPPIWLALSGTLGAVSLIAALVAVITGNEVALGILVGGTALLWFVTTARRVRTDLRQSAADGDDRPPVAAGQAVPGTRSTLAP